MKKVLSIKEKKMQSYKVTFLQDTSRRMENYGCQN